ncbi:similar to Saccharomyces cerevisiae YER120W SCS2 Integral ER membrane protein that regulates phospholipid metabolism via an interaction with the FFAT motif of Opi1p [Maudiozyma saulgeensis]|uniref:Similar to Saccharomyces cerevisiae YER120W SCS2 Integral ER membrane protein that regulates phospholipid metabolism via an interaction with the FFAT motif of Opi1p n=1 Tax=Maudiozyma saulgeensis TaxID=1789683 RepID=A0A1X7QYG7_9SACH|nr:similar to Saccharomyces cerevisiae YER120W SCS2 Integral ER membrane protein that regulates phospholipid metabolism via an interaction with the FFAT motif of Opi1p [Kazachstania saulgeensis]
MSLVEISPDVLEFKPPLTEQSIEYMTIVNNAPHNIAFKVKTTAPKFYCVRPNAAVVAPGESVEIQVIFLGLAEEPSAEYNCRDKFLVITLPAPEDLEIKDVSSSWSQLESAHSKEAISKKIKVKYLVEQEEQENEIPEEQEKIAQVQEANMETLKSENDQAQKEIKETVPSTTNVEESKPASTVKDEVSSELKSDSTLNLKLLLGIVLLAFIIRWFYN